MKPATVAVAAATVLSLTTPPLHATNDDPDARVLRAERWLKAALSHQPGRQDDAVTEVGLWTDVELRALSVDEQVIAQLIANPDRTDFKVVTIGKPPQDYTRWQRDRLHVLGCAASGDLHSKPCARILAGEQIDSTLTRLAKAASDEADFVVRHGALLHTDLAMFGPEPPKAPDTGFVADGGSIRVQMADGESNGLHAVPIHWEMARQLLDYAKRSATDTFVRRWYAATATWMQDREQHDTRHLKHARELFPEDPEILFLSGCQQETYAGPAIQAVLRTAVLPTGFTLSVAPEGTALRDAEDYFRRAIALNPARRDIAVHLGHVLLARGRALEAAAVLRQVDTTDQPPYSRYFHAMFLGAAEEAVARFDQARDAYARASEVFPGAQSPYLALSALATRRGDRSAALKEIARLFELPMVTREPDDPWWAYQVWQAQGVHALFERLYAPFAGDPR